MNRVCCRLAAAMVCVLASETMAQDTLSRARAEYRAENWDEARVLLETAHAADPSAETARLLGLTRYHLQAFDAAAPLLEQALVAHPDDGTLLRALTDIALARHRPEAAADYAKRLLAVDDRPAAALIAGRAFAGAGETRRALATLQRAWQRGDPRIRQQSALALVRLYAEKNEPERARALAARAIALDPDSFDALPLRELHRSLGQPRRRNVVLSLGYWLEHDDNVPLVSDPSAVPDLTDTEDVRHTLYGDLLYAGPISDALSLFAEAHLTHGVHEDLSRFDPTRLALAGGLGWNGSGWGFRLPLQLTRNWIDGETLRTSAALAPGVFFRPTGGSTLYLFASLAEDDFEDAIRPGEDRSGDVVTLGALFNATLADNVAFRAILSGSEYDTDGNNWQRDETRLYAYLTWRFSEAWVAGLGFDYTEAEFDNLNDVFLQRRDDETVTAFATLAWEFRPHWTVRAQIAGGERESGIELFDYERTVFSAGVSWTY